MNQKPLSLVYILDVKLPDQSPRKFSVHDECSAGLDPRNDLVLVDAAIGPKHFLFKEKDGLLTLTLLGPDHSTTLNRTPLEKEKTYLLDPGDVLKCGRVEIRIRQEAGPPLMARELKVSAPLGNTPINKSVKRQKFLYEADLTEGLAPSFTEGPEHSRQESDLEKKSPPLKALPPPTTGAWRKILFKVYGFFFDLCLTYFFLASLLPASGLLEKAQQILYPMTEFFNQTVVKTYPEIAHYKILSFLEFFLVFHFLMIGLALLLGNTPGAFLLGLRPVSNKALANRFRAYLSGLLTVFTLFMIVFDLPLYRGKSLKEWLSFHHRELVDNTWFGFSRKVLTPALILFFFLCPFFLPFPFSAVVVEQNLPRPRYQDVHVKFLSSHSHTFGVELKSELNSQYSLLPYFSPGKTGLILYDHATAKTLLAQEEWRLSTEEALFKLRFSNPFSSLWLPNADLNQETLKKLAFTSLQLSPVNFALALSHFGPFTANGLLFKKSFLKDFHQNESILALGFDPKNPFLLLSTSKDTWLFFFTIKQVIAYRVSVPEQTKLLDHFARDILAGMRFSQGTADKLKTPEILEALEAFEKRSPETLLTYYIYEAKNSAKLESSWRSFLQKNILQTKLALNGLSNKNIEKSFDDIISTLK